MRGKEDDRRHTRTERRYESDQTCDSRGGVREKIEDTPEVLELNERSEMRAERRSAINRKKGENVEMHADRRKERREMRGERRQNGEERRGKRD